MNNPFVSVLMIAYNHEKYLRDAIENVLMQQTDFIFELVIGEDCSTDSTRSICEFYAEKYPEVIRLLPSDRNYGMHSNFTRTLLNCRGKYIALCEGDDYWSDPLKLQKQVDFLENNNSFSACFHDCAILKEPELIILHNSSRANTYKKNIFNTEDLIQDWIINTCTAMFRSTDFILPEIFHEHLIDRLLFQLISLNGPIKYLNDEMAVYRQHPGGITMNKLTQSDFEKITLRWDKFNSYTSFKYNKLIRFAKRNLLFDYNFSKKGLSKQAKFRILVMNLDILYNKNHKSIKQTVVFLIKSGFKNLRFG